MTMNPYLIGADVLGAVSEFEIFGRAHGEPTFDDMVSEVLGDDDVGAVTLLNGKTIYVGSRVQSVAGYVGTVTKITTGLGGTNVFVHWDVANYVTDVAPEGLTVVGSTTVPQAGVVYHDKPTVTAVQTALAAKGFDPGKIDGVFGPKTSGAIKRMQSAVSIAQTGVIDYGVLSTLKVQAPASGPTRTEAGRSVSAAAQDVANVMNNAAAEAAKADTPAEVAEVANFVEMMSVQQPPAPPEVQAKAKAAVAQAKAAKTPAEVKAASEQVKSVAKEVAVAAVPGFWSQPVWTGAPVKRWQGAIGGVGIAGLVTGLVLAIRK
jgi:peptidoglycan hydrolase-like protein with peptidoglycan-binding domain